MAWKAFTGTAINDRLHVFSDQLLYMLAEGYICVVSKKITVWRTIFTSKQSEILGNYLPLFF